VVACALTVAVAVQGSMENAFWHALGCSDMEVLERLVGQQPSLLDLK
jgi:hypothetical protein